MPVVKDPPSEALVTGANVFIALITQLFFAYSLWIFSKKNGVLTSVAVSPLSDPARVVRLWLTCVVRKVVLALGSFGPGIWIASRFLQANSLFDIQTTKARIICGLWNGLGATCDVFIALVLSYYFHKSRSMSNGLLPFQDESSSSRSF
uniref:Phosphotransferase (EC) n=1 Tax=Ganoderma boninense TaxID=34458 RepID=A0A5K1JZR3_9APHY|nr:Phosphotransferase (EC [Ganoderma boninense]